LAEADTPSALVGAKPLETPGRKERFAV